MDKKVMYVIAAVAVVAVAAVAVFLVMNNTGSEDHSSASFEDTRLRIYGNANGDDQIDKTDLNIVKWIIDSNNDADNTIYRFVPGFCFHWKCTPSVILTPPCGS